MSLLKPNVVVRFSRQILGVIVLCVFVAGLSAPATAQLGPYDRDSARSMLEGVKDDLKKNYYDAAWRGMNLDARFKEAEDRIKQAQTRDQLIIAIAQPLMELNDSHTFFLPPFRAARVRYGFKMAIIGDDCVVVDVNPKTDASQKGLKAGDTVLSVDGFRPTREILWKLNYRYYSLMPARSVKLSVLSIGDQQPHDVEVLSKIEKTPEKAEYFTNIYRYNSERKFEDDRLVEEGEAIIWRMPDFLIAPERVDELMGKVRRFKTLILDLRGNGGGYEITLERLAGYFFDHDIKIAEHKSRKEMKPILAKGHKDNQFKGQLIVLVDGESASAAELFARTMQLEKRGTIVGDRTEGAVMTSRSFEHEVGVGGTLYYGTSITIADVIMSDAGRLEKTGVAPDEKVLPTVADIAAHRDPVLARAAAIAGFELPPEKAGKLFPVEWLK